MLTGASFTLLCLLVSVSSQLTNDAVVLNAFMQFYNVSGGDSWLNKTGWGGSDVCGYHGVTCNSGAIVVINLSANNLSGPIDGAWTTYSPYLMQLNMSSNSLTGSLPSTLSTLNQLQSIDFSGNHLTGATPDLSSNSNLKEFHIDGNKISSLGSLNNAALRSLTLNGNPLGVDLSTLLYLPLFEFNASRCSLTGDISSLRLAPLLLSVDISNNLLEGTLETIADHSLLRIAKLQRNFFTGSLPDFGKLTQLAYLDLSRNSLTGSLPQSLSSLSHLLYLDLSINALSGDLPQIWGPSYLYIALAVNQFTGSIPESIYNLNDLQALILQGNSLSGTLSPNITNLSNLQYLVLAANRLSGPLPDFPSRLSFIIASINSFTGVIPPSVCSLPLVTFDISFNGVGSNIPACLGNLIYLQRLALNYNQFVGTIPAGLSNLRGLTSLSLSGNNLEGDISSVILPSLVTLDLSYNRLNGTVPSEVSSMTSLTDFILSNNRLSGDLPLASIGVMPKLQKLDLSYNRFTGGVPGYAPTLIYLYIQQNNFSYLPVDAFETTFALREINGANNNLDGQLPDGSALSQVSYLNLRGNRLRGAGFGNLQLISLTYLDISDNRLSGIITPNIMSLAGLTYFNVSFNQFTGPFPSVSLPLLTTVDISHNSLSGTLPKSLPPNLITFSASFNYFNGIIDVEALSTSTSLQTLDLSHNDLSGEIPGGLGGLYRLSTLNLSSCQLSGILPASVSSLRALAVIDLSNNSLSGSISPLLSDPISIDISMNQFDGTMEWLAASGASLQMLNVSGCGFHGDMPSFTAKTKMISIDMKGNRLNGTMGDLSGCSLLQYLDLSGNSMKGQISAVSSAVQLINLSGNQFQVSDRLIITNQTTCNLSGNPLQCPISANLSTLCSATCTTTDHSPASLRLRIQGSISNFDQRSFTANFSSVLGISQDRIRIDKTTSGSVIVDSVITPPTASEEKEGSSQRVIDRFITTVQNNPSAYATYGIDVLLNGTASPIPQDTTGNDRSISGGAIAGIVVGSIAFILLVVAVAMHFMYKRKIGVYSGYQGVMIDMSNFNIGAAKKSILNWDELKDVTKIGEGSFGIVSQATWRDILVAVKQVRAEHINEEQVSSFLAEVAIVQGLRAHPNVVMFIGLTLPPHPLSLVTEFCEGGSLYNYLRRNAVEFEQKVKFIQGIALGMLHLHLEKIVHRDLAVRNILLSKHLEPKVSDFGMSRSEVKDSNQTASTIGPLKWMSPEALCREYSIKSDVFSFGVVVWEILRVMDPWEEYSPVEAAIAVSTRGERLPIPADCHPSLIKLMNLCWQTLPEDRPDFAEICAHLEMNHEVSITPTDMVESFKETPDGPVYTPAPLNYNDTRDVLWEIEFVLIALFLGAENHTLPVIVGPPRVVTRAPTRNNFDTFCLFAKEEVRNLFSPISIVESASDIDPIIILRNIFGQTSTKSFATQSNVVRLRLNALEDHLVVI
ncbi:putative LRR receptor-like serine/threonine-protein kinase [Planoprotostelium fungivorum]|uniref:Putative LRR receptor-like serine/threonine-protein kinase n=1 Tax=Planoprotostelium fungivorum TaxID=1890364 RepID=A0A2P6MVN9_9EUKA|nr:putative LRR receptor-like serine/threonine-protein kinase [Planoprotostelium fungivorum]